MCWWWPSTLTLGDPMMEQGKLPLGPVFNIPHLLYATYVVVITGLGYDPMIQPVPGIPKVTWPPVLRTHQRQTLSCVSVCIVTQLRRFIYSALRQDVLDSDRYVQGFVSRHGPSKRGGHAGQDHRATDLGKLSRDRPHARQHLVVDIRTTDPRPHARWR